VSRSNDEGERQVTHEAERLVEPTWKGLYRVGGILTIVWGAGGFISMLGGATLYKSGYPSSPESYLQLVSQHQALANGLWIIWMLGGFTFIAPTAAIYLALRRHNQTLALLGALLSVFYIFYDVSVTELNSLTLVSLSQGYAGATTDALRASYVAAATYGYDALPLQTVLSYGVGAVAWLLWSVAMAKSVFGQRTAIFGVIVNAIGIAGAASPVVPSSYALGLLSFFTPPLTSLWAIVVGFQLYHHRVQLAYMGSTVASADNPTISNGSSP
jgi:hypothetical protein